jgi:hypothetical protein
LDEGGLLLFAGIEDDGGDSGRKERNLTFVDYPYESHFADAFVSVEETIGNRT